VTAASRSRRTAAYGEDGLSPVDRLGVALSARRVRRHMPRGGPPRVIDLGCGHEATLLRQLAPGIASGLGVDVRIADGPRAVPGLSFREGAIEDVLPSLAGASADVVLMISVLEHLDDPAWALAECRRLLAPGGVLMINVPTWLGKRALEASAFRLGLSPAAEMDDHRMYYGHRDLWPLLVAAGFRPSRVRIAYHKLGLNLFAHAHAD
jgi:SAM-dependent methyltransferase